MKISWMSWRAASRAMMAVFCLAGFSRGHQIQAEDIQADPCSFAYVTTLPGDESQELQAEKSAGKGTGTNCSCKTGSCVGGCGWGGLIKPSDHCFDDFISPMTNPIYFEDPRTLTEARFVYWRHKAPLAVGSGEVNLFALQLRAALTDRLSIIATKDGYASSTNAILDDGWADINAGLKYNLFANYEKQRLLSLGATYLLPIGSTRTFQGNGDGEIHLFATGGAQVGCNGHWISAAGLRLPVDSSESSESWYWSNHFDYRVTKRVYAVAEVNWYGWLDSGDNAAVPGVEGLDLINFGMVDVTGNNIVTGALGAKFKPSGNMELGVAWEAPLTERRDILDNRLTVDVILRY